MRLVYQQAIISYCVDLTSPHAKSIPVANLIVADGPDGVKIAAVAVLVPADLDALARVVLDGMHPLIRGYVDEAFRRTSSSAPLGEVLARVYHSLRNTLHVTTISDPAEVEVASAEELGPLLNLLHQGLSRARPRATDSRPRAMFEVPPSFIWSPASRDENVAIAAG